MLNDKGLLTEAWSKWFRDLFNQIVGPVSVATTSDVDLLQTNINALAAEIATIIALATGPAGPTGPTGPTGSTGPAGSAGPTGPIGASVFLPGEDGPSGEMGPPGSQGPQGPQGASGPTGTQGLPGPTVFLPGDDGEVGEIGPPGAQGIQGPQGATGSTGASGSDGANGTNGVDGAQGSAGIPIFLPGDDGEAGEIGPPGPAGTGAPGANGTTGAQGPAGPAIFLLGDGDSPDSAPMQPPYSGQGQVWKFLGTASGSGTTVGPIVWFENFQFFFFAYLITGYSGTAVGRLLIGPSTPNTTGATNGNKLIEDVTANATSVSVPGMPLAVTLSNIPRSGWGHILGASGALKQIESVGMNGTVSPATSPLSIFSRGFFSDLGTNLPIKQAQLTAYSTLVSTTPSGSFNAGTQLWFWGMSNDPAN